MTDITKFSRNGSIRDIGDSKARNSIAKEFSTTTSYSTNDLILYDGQLYKFTSDHEAGIWNSSEVIATNISDNYLQLSGGNLTGTITSNIPSGTSWISGAKGTNSNLYFKKSALNTNVWNPSLVIQTKDGSSWSIGNYNNNDLLFIFCTSTDINNNNNNSHVNYKLNPDLGWNSTDWLDDTNITSKGYNSGHIYYRKIGKFCEIKGVINLKSNLTSTGGVVIGIMPEGYRPTRKSDLETDDHSYVLIPAGNANVGMSMIRIAPSTGAMRFFKPKGVDTWLTTDNLYLSAVFS